FGIYGALILTFACGAVIGAFATRAWGVHAIWLPAGFLAFTLGLFIVDERQGREP
ncbi:MAG: putative rane protein, partial [Mycobacterium sp.]|nr:putative rane protein [Mycobacterium sp.]